MNEVFIPMPPKATRTTSRRIWCNKMTGNVIHKHLPYPIHGVWVTRERLEHLKKNHFFNLPPVVLRLKKGSWLAVILLAFFLSSPVVAYAKGDYNVGQRCCDVVSNSVRWGHSIPGITYSPVVIGNGVASQTPYTWPAETSPVENLIDVSAWLRRMEWLFYPAPAQEWRPLGKRSETQWPTLLGALASALIAASVMGVPFVLLHARSEMDKDFPV